MFYALICNSTQFKKSYELCRTDENPGTQGDHVVIYIMVQKKKLKKYYDNNLQYSMFVCVFE
jgi:hypothetical protein